MDWRWIMDERTWLKRKYSAPKVASRYKSSHSDSAKKQKKGGVRAGIPGTPPGIRTMVLEAGTGKRRWVWL